MKTKTQQLRIIGGQWRSRRLSFPDIQGLRPTLDRVRETLFNWLQFQCEGRQVVDLFAGSGALGLEALSREARQATFVELHPQAAQALTANLKLLQTTGSEVIHTDAVTWLQSAAGQSVLAQADLVFLDPPFHQQLLQPCLDALTLRAGTWVYVEHETSLTPVWPADWQLHRSKRTKEFVFSLFVVGKQ